MESKAPMSPRFQARTAGVLTFLEGLAAVFGQIWVPGRLMVPADAVATAANVQGNETLFRLALAAGFVAVALHAAQTVLFYNLFRPVDRSVALLFVCFSVIALALQAVSSLFQLPVLTLLEGGAGVGAIGPDERRSLAYVLFGARAQAFNVYLVFFGFRCLSVGYLIARSIFLPRIIGVLMILSGVSYLMLLWPPLVKSVSPLNMILTAPGELSFVFWLLVVGVNGERWKEQARAAAARS